MVFEGYSLAVILRRQPGTVEVKNLYGDVRGTVTTENALSLTVRGKYVGVGTIEQIRYLRPVAAPKATGFIAEDSTTTFGHRSELKQHHTRRSAAYAPQHRG
jgi:hypothetical protein